MNLPDSLFNAAAIRQVIKTLPRKIAVEAVNFSKERFRDQAWVDSGPKKWETRKQASGRKSDNRAILVKSGRLRRSIRAVSVSDRQIVIGTDVPYAQAHNDGGVWDVSQNVRSHTRKAHSRKGRTVQEHSVRAFVRKREINLPQRQFMGVSDALNKRISRLIKKEFEEAVKKG